MTRFDPSSGMLRLLGFATLVTVIGLGVAVSRIPAWQEPSMTRWTATIPVEEGARGLEPGGRVLIGGYPRGFILSVDVLDGRHDGRGRPLVGIDFELPSEIALGRDAVIRRSVGIAGTNGVLDIPDPGARDRLFNDETPRVIAIDTSPPAGGAIGVLIGRRNGERIQAIAEAGDRFGSGMPARLRSVAAAARTLLDQVEATENELSRDTSIELQQVRRLAKRLAALGEKAMTLPPLLETLKHDLGVLFGEFEERIRRWTPTVDRILLDTDIAEQDVAAISRRLDEIAPTLQTARNDLESAVRDAEAAATRLSSLAPEAEDAMRRTMARMVLAGGQLRRALDDLLPLALRAISVSPDRRSTSRRLLLESVDDGIRSIADVRDAARRLDMLLELADALPSGDPAFDAGITAELDARVAELEDLLDALATRLRDEIRADERR